MKNNRITLNNVIANEVKLDVVENPVGLRDNLVEWPGIKTKRKDNVIQSRLRRGIFFFIYNRQVPRLS